MDLGPWFLVLCSARPANCNCDTKMEVSQETQVTSVLLLDCHSSRFHLGRQLPRQMGFPFAGRWKVVGIYRCYVFSSRPGDIHF